MQLKIVFMQNYFFALSERTPIINLGMALTSWQVLKLVAAYELILFPMQYIFKEDFWEKWTSCKCVLLQPFLMPKIPHLPHPAVEDAILKQNQYILSIYFRHFMPLKFTSSLTKEDKLMRRAYKRKWQVLKIYGEISFCNFVL